CLLVFDNCEHLVGACATLAAAVLRGCPNLKLLATSREPLGIPGERVYAVPTLALPLRNGPPRAATIAGIEAVRPFAARAEAGPAQPSFELNDAIAPALAEICRQLDGIPLAIELAAARLKVLSVDQILERLSDRFRLLTGGSRAALPRQQTLRAAIEWSHDQL